MNIGSATASGLDINTMVNKIVDSERAPKEARINEQRGQISTTISAYGQLKSSLDGMKNMMADFRRNDAFSARMVTVDNDEVLNPSVDADAIPGKYTIDVQQLAQSHKIVSGSFDEKDKLGAGKLSIALGGKHFNVEIPEDESKALDVVRHINRHPANTGVMASLIKDDVGTRLVLSSDKPGEDNTIKVRVDAPITSTLQKFGFNPNNELNSMSEMQVAKDSRVLIDGLAVVTSQNNVIEDAIKGVDLNLEKVTDGIDVKPVVVEVAYDRDSVRGAIEQFVQAYNQFENTSERLAKFDPQSQEKGPLVGDSIVRISNNQLRAAFSTPLEKAPESLSTLSELGIKTTLEGSLEIDYKVLDKHLDKNFSDVGEFLGGRNGFARKIEELIHAHTGITGSIRSRENSLNDQVLDLNNDQDKLDRRMDSVQKRTFDQFAAMDNAMGKMQSQFGSMMSMMPQ
ncbi:flagellar filament capping protein FliD [Photobacterium sanguinicancri]|uniref:Flagellar hook-associated protein 2 n=2 Tax=Photobacterium sanguinicancri TaxID=875932 RepID=A0AAW7Y599_9GAMM|nr:flagellar filament capping protein FliD [Photobacterium sanguinicancri]MDO6543562.1 flagellar filament capping protein FliD [Photobacterium sanguinicancri]OZS45653.1 flagellar hook protein [Photobacterium sanguinicancri]